MAAVAVNNSKPIDSYKDTENPNLTLVFTADETVKNCRLLILNSAAKDVGEQYSVPALAGRIYAYRQGGAGDIPTPDSIDPNGTETVNFNVTGMNCRGIAETLINKVQGYIKIVSLK